MQQFECCTYAPLDTLHCSPRRLYNVGLRQATGYGLFVMTGHIATYMTKVNYTVANSNLIVS
jgi:hypothetical protein